MADSPKDTGKTSDETREDGDAAETETATSDGPWSTKNDEIWWRGNRSRLRIGYDCLSVGQRQH